MRTEQAAPHAFAAREEVHWWQLHRWLNPFAKQQGEMVTPLTPGEIERALRPHLWSYRWTKTRYGLHGSLAPWGFRLRRDWLTEPCLTARCQEGKASTTLELVYGRTAWGLIGWFWTFVVLPYLVIAFSLNLLDTGSNAASQSAVPWFNQDPILMAVIVTNGAMSVHGVVRAARSRNDFQYFRGLLVEILEASTPPTTGNRALKVSGADG